MDTLARLYSEQLAGAGQAGRHREQARRRPDAQDRGHLFRASRRSRSASDRHADGGQPVLYKKMSYDPDKISHRFIST
jgi:hypothetical protein